MSQENVELVKALLPPPDADWSLLVRDADGFALVRETLSPIITNDFESVMVWPAVRRAYAGLDGLRKNWLDWLEPWATYRITIDDLIDDRDRILVLSRNFGRRKDMETEVELIAAATLTFRAGKIARWEDYAERAAALEAAGISE
jgi:hypothetical protein